MLDTKIKEYQRVAMMLMKQTQRSKARGPVFCAVSKSIRHVFWDEVDRRKQMEIIYASNGKISNCFLYVKLGDLDLHATSQLR